VTGSAFPRGRMGTPLVPLALLAGLSLLLPQSSALCSNPALDRPLSVAVSPDSSLRATGEWDQHARVWSVRGGTLIHTFPLRAPVFAVAFSPDGQLLATGTAKSGHDAVKLWRVSDWKLV